MLSRGDYFLEHQRYIADVAHEIDPATGLLWYDLVVILIPRQNGKTTYVEAKLTRSAEAGKFRQLIYTAQNADRAREKIIDELHDQRMANHPYWRGKVRPRRSNGSAHLRWLSTGSKLFIVPSNDSAADGKTVDDGVLDEAFIYTDMSIVSSIQPTMLTRPDPQLTVVSTVGDGSDGLLQHYQDVGIAATRDPASRIAYFEWSAGDDDDPDDPDTWHRVMPALGATISPERVASYRTSMGSAEFARSMLNRRPTLVELAAVDLDAWQACAAPAPLPIAAPYVAGFHVHPDREHSTVAVAGTLPDGNVGVVCDRRAGTGWLAATVESIAGRGGLAATVADRGAGAGGIIDQLAGRGLAVVELTANDVGSMCGTFLDELAARTLRHQDDRDLTAAVTGSRRRPLGGTTAWDQRTAEVDLAPLQAATWAIGQYRRLYPAGARVERIT